MSLTTRGRTGPPLGPPWPGGICADWLSQDGLFGWNSLAGLDIERGRRKPVVAQSWFAGRSTRCDHPQPGPELVRRLLFQDRQCGPGPVSGHQPAGRSCLEFSVCLGQRRSLSLGEG